MSSVKLKDVSDTALWVAEYRAMETRRPDAIFRDPYAERLAGTRGADLVKSMGTRGFAWPMIVRTAVMDEIIVRSVAQDGVDTVLDLAAGLDARPYRLPLPKSLRWVEVDLPDMVAFKEERLRDDEPVCRLERIAADLTNPVARKTAIDSAAAGSSRMLVVTEGLLIYLTPEQVADLAAALHEPAAAALWLTDLVSPRLMKMLTRRHGKHLAAADAPFRFAPAAGTKFFETYGWREREFRSTFDEALRLNRAMRGAWLFKLLVGLQPPKKREETSRMGGMVLLERTETTWRPAQVRSP